MAQLSSSVIGDFSVDGQRSFCPDRRNLNRLTVNFTQKSVRYDLNLAISSARRRDTDAYNREWLVNILQWLLCNPSHLSPAPDFVSARKTLRRVMLSAYETEEKIFYATKYNGTIYVCAYIPDEEDANSEQRRKMSSWGHKFEQFMADGSNPANGMDENESYNCVYRGQLGYHSLIYKCEVDGVDSALYRGNGPPSQRELVELKTQHMKFSGYGLNKYKLRDAWAQCALAGVSRLVVGYRDDSGIVHSVKVLQVDDFQRLSSGFFSQNEMMSFLNKFLDYIKRTVTVDNPDVVYEIKVLNRAFTSHRLPAAHAPVTVLYPWYVQKMNKIYAQQ